MKKVAIINGSRTPFVKSMTNYLGASNYDLLSAAMNDVVKKNKLEGEVLGDVIISVPTARRQAEEAGKDVLDEVTMLAAHGLLHLLGWDHDTPAKDRRMKAETDRLLAAAAPRRRSKKGPLKAQNRSGSVAQSPKTSRRPARRARPERPRKAQ